MTTTTVTRAQRTTSAVRRVLRRWPTVLGLALGADVFLGAVTTATTRGYAHLVLLMPLLYVVLALVRRRGATWPVFGLLIGAFLLLRLQAAVDPAVVLLAAAAAVTIWGAGHGRHRDPDVRVQLAGLAGFAAVAVVALAADPGSAPDVARWLVAAGMLGHGVWDWVHLAKDRTVARSYAEWCGALDVAVAVGLVVVPMLGYGAG